MIEYRLTRFRTGKGSFLVEAFDGPKEAGFISLDSQETLYCDLQDYAPWMYAHLERYARCTSIERIEVKPEYRNCGIGSELMLRTLRRLDRMRCDATYLHCYSLDIKHTHQQLSGFYRKFGFRKVPRASGLLMYRQRFGS